MQNLLRQEEGQDLAEYALILALVVSGSLTILGTLGTDITSAITKVTNSL
jgi:Flp pilus assembly pilin Flp